MIGARGLVLVGASFATLAAFMIGASGAAGPPNAGVSGARDADAAAPASWSGAATAVASRTRLAASHRSIALAFVGGTKAHGSRTGRASASAPQIPTQTVTGVSPNAGASGTGGEQMVTITGSGFTGATDVFFGSGTDVNSTAYPCLSSPSGCFNVVNDNQIVADTPVESAATVDVTVGTGAINSPQDQYSYFDPPTVASVASPQPQGATGIAVTGTNFSYPGVTPFASGVSEVDLVPTGGGSTVPITAVCASGGQANCFLATDDTDLTINLPNSMGGGTYDTEVITPGGTSATSSNDQLTVLPPAPTLTTLNPSSGSTAGGDNVTLTGTNFTGATEVTWGTTDIAPCGSGTCFTVDTDTQITVDSIPANAPGNVNVDVTTPSGTSASVQYTYIAAPSVTRVSPNDGTPAGGNVVSLTGTDFESAGTPITSQVTVTSAPPVNITATPCGVSPTSPCFTVNSGTSITIGFMPGPGTGQVNITVTTIGGTSPATSANIYTYNPLVPTVTELLPKYGATAGGESVSLFGSGFGAAGQDFVTDVLFGSTDVPSSNSYPCPTSTAGCFVVVGPTQLAIYTPAHTVGTVDVEVTTPRGTSGAATADKYTFVPPGAYTAISPYRACDTRPPASGIAPNQCDTGSNHTLGMNGVVTAQITKAGGPVPPGAQAVVVNVTAIDHSSGGTLVIAYPAGTTRPLASNINLAGDTVESNLVIVQLSQAGGTAPAGAITLYNALGSADVIVDVEGYFSTPPGGGSHAGEFHSIPPLRICDSRADMGTICAGATSTPLLAGKWRDVVLSGLPPGAPVGTPSIPTTPGVAAAAVFNLTGTNGTVGTYLAVAPALANHACPAGRPAFSNLNPPAGIALPNRVISKLGPNQDVCLFSPAGSINFITDVNGWFGSATAPAGVLFYSVPPTRVCDTRPNSGFTCSLPAPGLTPRVTKLIAIAGATAVPADDPHSVQPVAVVANLTGIAGTANTVFILYPSDKAAPRSSDLNPSARQVIANLAVVGLSTTTSDGDISLYNAAGDINAVLDVAGWFQ